MAGCQMVLLKSVAMFTIDRAPEIRWLFHFTDSSNVPLIRELKGLCSRANLIERGVEFRPGGNEWSLRADERYGMDRYVHLCLRKNHPMEYLARQDGRIRNTTWLCVAGGVLEFNGVLYSDGVSNSTGTNVVPIEEAINQDLIDFEVLFGNTDWHDPEIQARLSRIEKCEVLVPDHIPLDYIYFYFEEYR